MCHRRRWPCKRGCRRFICIASFRPPPGKRPSNSLYACGWDARQRCCSRRDDAVLDIALECGFQSHEAFCRAFRKRFGMTPSDYRARGFADGSGTPHAALQRALVDKIGPCIKLFHTQQDGRPQKNDMQYSITKKEIPAQPVLVVRRRIKPADLAATLGEVLGHVFQYAQQNGIAMAGQPFTRYLEWGPGLVDHRGWNSGDSKHSRNAAGGSCPAGCIARRMGGDGDAHRRLRQTGRSSRRDTAMDRSRRPDLGRRALGDLYHRSGRFSRSQGLEDGSVLADRGILSAA